VATTDRGIYYTDGGNDGDLADLNVITKAIADSTEAAIDAVAVRAVGGVGSAMLSAGPIEVTVTTGISPTGRWSVVAVPLGMWAGRVRVVSTMGTTATIRVTETELPPDPPPATPQPLFFWQAVAY